MIPIIVCVAVVIFTIMYFVPGDPVKIMLGPNADESDVVKKTEELGLNDPYIIRLGNYMKNVFFHFDFGTSLINGTSITDSLLERFPRTLLLSLLSIGISLIFGIPLGITSAVHPNSWRDTLSMLASLIMVSMPRFWFGLILVIIFSLKLRWFPSQGMEGIKYWVLPSISNAVMTLALLARQTRSSMLTSLRSDYIVTSRAKGVSEREIIYNHALPNAIIPIITTLFSALSGGIAGSLIVENIFSIPGIGTYLINGVNNRDYFVVQGCVIFIAIVLSFVVLLTDIVYAFADPRIKVHFEKTKSKGKITE
jgi:peptide/nickel transport system permease protein